VNGSLKTIISTSEKLEIEQILERLRITDPRHEKQRIEEAKGGLLEDLYYWVLVNPSFKQWHDDPGSRLLWIKGDPGKGKTMLLCGIIDELKKSRDDTVLISYFFCQATNSGGNNAVAVLRGLLYMLVSRQPSLASHIRKYNHAGKTMFEDQNAWFALTEIFASMLDDLSLNTTYLIIDALDECATDMRLLLEFIVKQSSASSPIKWIVSSRNWPDIEERLRRAGHKVMLSLEIEQNAEQVSRAVKTYINYRLSKLPNLSHDTLLRDQVQAEMEQKANGIFLWVSLVMKELESVKACDIEAVLNEIPEGLRDMYRRMMESIERLNDRDSKRCQQVLSAVIAAYRPLHLQELHALSGLPTEYWDVIQDTATTVRDCSSLLMIQDERVFIIHQSAKDFLSDEARSYIHPLGIGDTHHSMFTASLKVMSSVLKRNMYNLPSLGYPIEQVVQPAPDPLVASRYSCVYWVDHLDDWNRSTSADFPDKLGVVDTFIRNHYLYWLEALSLCKSMSKGVASMVKLRSLVQVCLK
jgi:hypothetical protein